MDRSDFSGLAATALAARSPARIYGAPQSHEPVPSALHTEHFSVTRTGIGTNSRKATITLQGPKKVWIMRPAIQTVNATIDKTITAATAMRSPVRSSIGV